MFKRSDLEALANIKAAPVVSIYLPTHEKGREIRQDPIRLKNALQTVAERLAEAGHRPPEIEALLAPAQALVDDEVFWRYQGLGLALFMAEGLFQQHRLPIEVRELQVVGPRAHLKPLLPLLARDGRFYVLTTTAHESHLYEGSRFALRRLDADLPQGVEAIAARTDYEGGAHAAPPARPRVAPSVGMPASQAFGEAPEEQRKSQFVDHLRHLQAAVRDALGGDQAPLVLVAAPESQGHFRAVAGDLPLAEEGVQTDPASLDGDELLERTYAVVRPGFEKAREEDVGHFKALKADDGGRASTKPDEVVSAAVFGRVDTLFVARGRNMWGRFDEAANKVHLEGEETGEGGDLLDLAATKTLLQGGKVHALAPEDMPSEGPLCAILRY
ncbi:MAG: hypothetical protein KDG89_14070 [Geminicoccaceae bacterium]|nr:hypothetical protein [Geminicoccaceae bacterium]